MAKLTQEQIDKLDHEEKKYKYHARHSQRFTVQLSTGAVQAVGGLMQLTEREHHEVQQLMKSGRPDLTQNLAFIDEEAAKAVIAADKKARENMAGQAHRGTATTGENITSRKPEEMREIVPQIPPGSSPAQGMAHGAGGEALKAAALDVKEVSEFSTASVAADDAKSDKQTVSSLLKARINRHS